jgi:hypothetical protein
MEPSTRTQNNNIPNNCLVYRRRPRPSAAEPPSTAGSPATNHLNHQQQNLFYLGLAKNKHTKIGSGLRSRKGIDMHNRTTKENNSCQPLPRRIRRPAAAEALAAASKFFSSPSSPPQVAFATSSTPLHIPYPRSEPKQPHYHVPSTDSSQNHRATVV